MRPTDIIDGIIKREGGFADNPADRGPPSTGSHSRHLMRGAADW